MNSTFLFLFSSDILYVFNSELITLLKFIMLIISLKFSSENLHKLSKIKVTLSISRDSFKIKIKDLLLVIESNF